MKVISTPVTSVRLADITQGTVFSYNGGAWVRTETGVMALETAIHYNMSAFTSALPGVVYHPRAQVVLDPKE